LIIPSPPEVVFHNGADEKHQCDSKSYEKFLASQRKFRAGFVTELSTACASPPDPASRYPDAAPVRMRRHPNQAADNHKQVAWHHAGVTSRTETSHDYVSAGVEK
jgi:hypothetical protein